MSRLDSFDFVTIQSLRGGQVANISTSALFIQHGKYPQVTNVCQIYQSWEHGLTMQQTIIISKIMAAQAR